MDIGGRLASVGRSSCMVPRKSGQRIARSIKAAATGDSSRVHSFASARFAPRLSVNVAGAQPRPRDGWTDGTDGRTCIAMEGHALRSQPTPTERVRRFRWGTPKWRALFGEERHRSRKLGNPSDGTQITDTHLSRWQEPRSQTPTFSSATATRITDTHLPVGNQSASPEHAPLCPAPPIPAIHFSRASAGGRQPFSDELGRWQTPTWRRAGYA